MRVVVIGAGLGGLCLAQGLRQAGIEVDVYERDPDITARFQGYRIGLDASGLTALRHCLPARWHPLLDATLGDLAGPRLVVDPWLNRIEELAPLRATAADRHVLRHLLRAGLDEHLHTGKELTGYRVGPDHTVRAGFADGSTTSADLLVGADGINSAVRGVLAPHTTPTDTGVRFVIGRTALTERFAPLVPGFGTVVRGAGISLLLGLMRFRRPPAAAARQLAPGVTLPDTRDYVRWVMQLLPAAPGTDAPPGRQAAQRTVLARIEGWHPELRALIEQTEAEHSAALSIRVVHPGARWPLGPVTLLGDAIHATSPSGGNGANTALRDADLLRRTIAAAAGRDGLRAAVDDYERQMFGYGAEAVEHSLATLPAFMPATPAGQG